VAVCCYARAETAMGSRQTPTVQVVKMQKITTITMVLWGRGREEFDARGIYRRFRLTLAGGWKGY